MLPHRAHDLMEIISRIEEQLKLMHRTDQPVLFWPGTGSSGWEISIVNLLSPGDTVVATVSGNFGLRWATVAEKLGLNVVRVDVEWGQPVTPDLLRAAISGADNVKAALITHNETSTGVTNPLADLAKVARDADALVLVDAVSSAGALPLEVGAWDLDCVVSGTQKAWMCPPGLAIAAFSERALAAAENAGYPRFFYDVRANINALADGTTPTTAAESMLFALDAALAMMADEGIEQIWARHARLGNLVRQGLTAAGLRLFANPDHASDTVTAFHAPAGLTSQDFKRRVFEHSGVELALGQGDYTNTTLRLGHMGWVDAPELEATLESIAAVAGADAP
jgi:aspartate aminotransferase-like enzyme